MTKEHSIFNLPISYLDDKQLLAEHIKTDLELTGERENNLYDTVFQPDTIYGKQNIALWSQHYTANKEFIKDSQKIVKTLYKKKDELASINQSEVEEIWKEIKTETGFTEKYHYLFKNCTEIRRISSPAFTPETRNPLNRVGKYYVTIIELDVNRTTSCINN